jgi:RND family efflux transporter MFP subunit
MSVQAASAILPWWSRAWKSGRLGWVAVVAGIVAAAVLYAAVPLPRARRQPVLAGDQPGAGTAVTAVTLVTPRLVSDPGVTLPGTIEAMQTAAINARTTGYLRRLTVDIGSRVKAGQLLAEIAAPDVEQQLGQAQAQTAQSQAAVSQAQATVAQGEATVAQDQADVARQQATVEQADAQTASARAKVSQAEAVREQADAQVAHARQALAQQHASLGNARAQQELARVEFRRSRTLALKGFEARGSADQALTTLRAANANVGLAEAAVRATQADVDAAAKGVAASEAAIESARADLEASRKNAKAAEAALASTEAVVRSAKAGVRASQANVRASQSTVVSNEANARRYAILRSFEQVTAPFDGVITARNVDVGALINAGGSGGNNPATSPTPSTSMLGIARTDAVRILVSVPQTYVPALRAGSAAQVTVRELPGRTFAGRVTVRAGALDAATRTQLVEVHLPNRDGVLVPGMYAEVRLTPAGAPARLQIPASALVVDSEGTRVANVGPPGQMHFLTVQVGRDFGPEVEIRSGLIGNEQLVDNPSDTLSEGARVTVTPAAPTP